MNEYLINIRMNELSHLIKRIHVGLHKHIPLKNQTGILQSYNNDDWMKYVERSIKTDGYDKIQIINGNTIDVYIIKWNAGSKSEIHDHPEYGCLAKILKGQLNEYIYETKENDAVLLSKNIRNENDIMYMEGSKVVHKIENCGDEIAVSLHIYHKIDEEFNMKIFNEL